MNDSDAIRPTHVEVNLGHIAQNFDAIRAHVGTAEVMPVVKANAYGHGIVEVSWHLAAHGATCFGVALLEEAVVLRQAGITQPILVFGGVATRQIPQFIEHDLMMAASSIDKMRQIDEAAAAAKKKARVHLKIDTGMERIGVHWYSAEKLLEASLGFSNVEVAGIYSHFACSDAEDLSSANEQLARFLEALEFYPKRGLKPPLRHIANSGGILQLPESHLDLVRPGIMLYGVYPSRETKQPVAVKAAMSWKSQVVYFKVVQPGNPVSYGSTWQSDHPVRVVTVPVGYGDGYFRALSNRGSVLIRGQRHPIVGRVCMDQFMVNLEWGTAYNGDAVTIIGCDGDETISMQDVADWADTIPYEVLTNINARVPRVYV
ncbi:alanine racemase [Prosthecobacter sp.]|uniref:alanine racemase n=1 Tax=Prosthecobacter sp. TaxID=1965333 RepID=UPI001D44E296|nr:alanine racemase [Prosthecobacter sp.]MCB1277176.1 alanine racemase [Prosthecobacter sp.]